MGDLSGTKTHSTDSVQVCQNCKQEFVIEPEDFQFYEKIKVPAPTWCPECRFQRRLAWRNEWRLFRNKDAQTGKELFTNFSPGAPVKIYERDYWSSDNWDPLQYGMEIDWSRPFLAQVKELLAQVPIFSRAIIDSVNSDYCMNAGYLKNSFMVFNSDYVEDSAYIFSTAHINKSFDCELSNQLELCYGCFNNSNCYRTVYSVDCESCHDSILCRSCVSCANCFGCANLKSKFYHIFNEPYSKEEYAKKMASLELDTYSGFSKVMDEAYSFWKKHPLKFAHVKQNLNVSGEYVFNSKNVKEGYRIMEDAEDCRFCQFILLGPEKGCYDHTSWGKGAENIYEAIQIGDGSYNIKFSVGCYTQAKDIEYSLFCTGGKNLFGCVSAHHKQFCILNKQYTEKEFNELVLKIREHMKDMPYSDSLGREYRYGEFFPSEFAPYSYSETIAQEYFPLLKEEALKKSFTWRDDEKRAYPITMKLENIPDSIVEAKEDITKEVIECAHKGNCAHACNGVFRITPEELQFLQKMKIPLPRLCPHCRHYERIIFRNSFRLYHRKCECAGTVGRGYANDVAHFHEGKPCPNEFETPYDPNRKEIIYCEQCYNSEVA